MDNYISTLNIVKNKLFKILPLKETENAYLLSYIESVLKYIRGLLKCDVSEDCHNALQEVECVLLYFMSYKFDVLGCKREIFRLLHLIDSVISRMGESE